MLEKWALLRHCTDLRNDVVLSRPAGSPDIDIMRQEMKAWYFHLLATAQPEILHISQIYNAVSLIPTSAPGLYFITLPEEFLRLIDLDVETSAGRRRVKVIESNSREAVLQNNPRTMAGPHCPVAFRPVAGDSTMLLFDNDRRAPKLVSLRAVTTPPEGTYPITEAALSLISPQI